MAQPVEGLHHVTSLATSAVANNAFFTGTLGLRRVKKTVNFDAPDVYHLYYGDETGTPGTVMTYFPYERAQRGTRGTGEISVTAFSIPEGSLRAWQTRLEGAAVAGLSRDTRFGETRLEFEGPDGERFALVERADGRTPWTGGGVDAGMAIRGFDGVTLRLAETGPTADLLRCLGYEESAHEGTLTRFSLSESNGAGIVDLETVSAPPAGQGAGSVHHVAFAVPDDAAQKALRAALTRAGMQVTPQIDRDYFQSIYFRSPGGILFEIATNAPGFTRDEDPAHLGEALKLPRQHEHLRPRLERDLADIDA
ncbi:VOC family protein [Rhodovulum euryhalinum]|uniref:Glyoxalase family protein n=1 Tax=Rhodovulum euryhalinum TaxID=35805 RepID=A0A4R2KLJ3_9RHOB|nr:VOC family protein [Rhodovulum euryhalinum]TCO73387.1 glyoxalase family protein [Rhodovulum euryhalinum]